MSITNGIINPDGLETVSGIGMNLLRYNSHGGMDISTS